MEDAGRRVSRYLATQFLVNTCYGICVAIGLQFIGVPNAVLWGVLAGVLRFIPYVGPWVGALLPVLLSFAISSSWFTPLITIALFIVLEAIVSNFVEPWLYGANTGVSPIALIISAVFWTWLWGPGWSRAFYSSDRVSGGDRAACSAARVSRNFAKRRSSAGASRGVLPSALVVFDGQRGRVCQQISRDGVTDCAL